mmetsp:Transcript_75035/g.178413  ORF Transcript_75035/g.178413 Transcript_75035/m.178413 type:complete len:235 (+) Transcript_75035:171-875(+)
MLSIFFIFSASRCRSSSCCFRSSSCSRHLSHSFFVIFSISSFSWLIFSICTMEVTPLPPASPGIGSPSAMSLPDPLLYTLGARRTYGKAFLTYSCAFSNACASFTCSLVSEYFCMSVMACCFPSCAFAMSSLIFTKSATILLFLPTALWSCLSLGSSFSSSPKLESCEMTPSSCSLAFSFLPLMSFFSWWTASRSVDLQAQPSRPCCAKALASFLPCVTLSSVFCVTSLLTSRH